MPETTDPDLLVGYGLADDGGVYRIGPDQALVQTVDFFTPIVDDPFAFGAIAAANSLSDIYAMGGRPLTALNIAGFPNDELEPEVLNQILRGGHSKVDEAGAVLLGGHTVQDPELKYGLAATGLVHPDAVLTNAGALPGDRLVLTKKLGTGLIANAFKAGDIGEDDMEEAVASMCALNAAAAEQAQAVGVNACTDITGFGLLGHASEMAAASKVSLVFDALRVPAMELALELGGRGPLAGGSKDNQDHLQNLVTIAEPVPPERANVMFDAQTSGGLLVAVAPGKADLLLESLHRGGVPDAALVGEAAAENPGRVLVRA